jgi:hypothetical protein
MMYFVKGMLASILEISCVLAFMRKVNPVYVRCAGGIKENKSEKEIFNWKVNKDDDRKTN